MKPRERFHKTRSRPSGVVSYCIPCIKSYGVERYTRLRLEVLTHYGGGSLCCSLCEENIYKFLVLDHVDGDIKGAGIRDHREIGTGSAFLLWLKRNQFPSGFRVLCHNCNHLVLTKKPWKQACQKVWFQKLRTDILRHYSGSLDPSCVCCGQDEIDLLTVDHLKGGGSQHRKVVGKGSSFYRWLRSNGYPVGYQILCHNCNHAKGQVGSCPHQGVLHG